MSEPKSAPEGWVYVMMSPGLEEGLLKIGASTNHPTERARQLSMSTSAAQPFYPVYYRRVAFPFQVEAKIHVLLASCRINPAREFFRLPLHKAIEVMERFEELREILPAAMALPWAELFATFDPNGPDELTPEEQAKCRALETRLR